MVQDVQTNQPGVEVTIGHRYRTTITVLGHDLVSTLARLSPCEADGSVRRVVSPGFRFTTFNIVRELASRFPSLNLGIDPKAKHVLTRSLIRCGVVLDARRGLVVGRHQLPQLSTRFPWSLAPSWPPRGALVMPVSACADPTEGHAEGRLADPVHDVAALLLDAP